MQDGRREAFDVRLVGEPSISILTQGGCWWPGNGMRTRHACQGQHASSTIFLISSCHCLICFMNGFVVYWCVSSLPLVTLPAVLMQVWVKNVACQSLDHEPQDRNPARLNGIKKGWYQTNTGFNPMRIGLILGNMCTQFTHMEPLLSVMFALGKRTFKPNENRVNSRKDVHPVHTYGTVVVHASPYESTYKWEVSTLG